VLGGKSQPRGAAGHRRGFGSGPKGGTNDAAAKGNGFYAEDCAGNPPFLTRLGMFCLPSTPPGYTLIGGFVPAGVMGLPRRGLVSGTAYTTPTQVGMDGSETFGPALPGAFAITASP
jgi:hypothetical protein